MIDWRVRTWDWIAVWINRNDAAKLLVDKFGCFITIAKRALGILLLYQNVAIDDLGIPSDVKGIAMLVGAALRYAWRQLIAILVHELFRQTILILRVWYRRVFARIGWRNRTWIHRRVARHIWNWLIWHHLGWIGWVRWVGWRVRAWNWVAVWINWNDLSVWRVGYRFFHVWISNRRRQSARCLFIGMVAIDNWRIFRTKSLGSLPVAG